MYAPSHAMRGRSRSCCQRRAEAEQRGAEERRRVRRNAPARLVERQPEAAEVRERPVHGQRAAGEGLVAEVDRVPALSDGVAAERIGPVRHARGRGRIGHREQLGNRAQRRKDRAVGDVDAVGDHGGELAMGERRPDDPRRAVMER